MNRPQLVTLILATLCALFPAAAADVVVGAARPDQYLPLLRGKRVGLYSNHTGIVGGRHSLDLMLENGVDVIKIFSPEHGFRGNADAGEHVGDSRDPQTGVEIVSLYGNKNPNAAVDAMRCLDVVVVDIQDVGLRFYTYYCTMLQLMNVAAEQG